MALRTMTAAEIMWHCIGAAERNGAKLRPEGPNSAEIVEFEQLRAKANARQAKAKDGP